MRFRVKSCARLLTQSAAFLAVISLSSTVASARPSSYDVCSLLKQYVADAMQFRSMGLSRDIVLMEYFVFGAGVPTFAMLESEPSLDSKGRNDWKFMISLGVIGIADAAFSPGTVAGKDYEAAAMASCMMNVQRWKDGNGVP